MNYYELLKVPPTASFEEIKKAYLLLSKMMHPDKFDAKTQRDQWEKANEILKDLNAAFTTLKDPTLRRQYDLMISGNSQNQNNSRTNNNPPPHSGSIVKSGEAYIENFPDEIQSRLKKLGENQFQNSMTLVVTGISQYKWAIGISSLALMFPLWNIYSEPWEGGMLLLGLMTVAAFSFWIANSILGIKEYNQRKTNSGIFLTSLHLVEIEGNYCRYFWRRDMKDIKVVHNHKNGQYTGTDIAFIFDVGNVSIHYSEQKSIQNIAEYLKRSDAYIDKIVESENWNQLLSENIFTGAEELTNQHLKFKPPSKRMDYWKIAFPAICCIVAMVFVGNYYFSDIYLWNVANNSHTTNSYKKYLYESKIRFYNDRAEDSCWSVAKVDGKISSLRDYMSGNRVMKYSDDAKVLIKQRYQQIKQIYQATNQYSQKQKFVTAVCDWLDRAMETGETTIKVVFSSENTIPQNFESQIMKRTKLRNILPINDAFSDEQNLRRNSAVFEKFKAAFAGSIPVDALSLQMADTSKANESDVFIAYTVSPGQSLYFRDEDSAKEETIRPFYPGVLYSWNCFVLGNDRQNPYILQFSSKPAENFRLTNQGVYNDMANSAFEDLESELTSLVNSDFKDKKHSEKRDVIKW